MKKVFSCSYLIFIFFFFSSCANYGFFWGQFACDTVDERSPSVRSLSDSKLPDFSSQNLPPSSVYSVLIVSDLHFGSKRENLDEKIFLDWLDSYYKKYSQGESADFTKLPRFIVNLGDTADGGHDSEFRDYVRFEKKIKAVCGKYLYGETENTPEDERKFKIYGIIGNHDLYNDGGKGFAKYVFPYISSYHFSIDANPADSFSGFSFYFLDSGNGTTGTKQLDDFKEKISRDSNPKIVFTHYPVWAGGTDLFMILQNNLERNILLTYFAENKVKQVYEGHAHKNYGYDFKKFREDVIGSLRYSARAKKQCAIFTLNEETCAVATEIIEF